MTPTPRSHFDTFYASPPDLFDYISPEFAWGPIWTDTSAEARWLDVRFAEEYAATTQRFTLIVPEGVVPAVLPDDCAPDFAVLAQISTDATAKSTGAELHHRDYVIVDLNQPLCPGDVDGDGYVGQPDLGILLAYYGEDC